MISAARVGEHNAVENTRLYRSPASAMRSMVGVGITPPQDTDVDSTGVTVTASVQDKTDNTDARDKTDN